MPDYSNTIIYKIYCKDENVKDFYVGATCNFIRRKSYHKISCFNKNELMKNNIPLYCFIRLNGGWDNWKMEKIERVNCRDKKHRNHVEAKYIKELGANLNDRVPQDIEEGLNKQEWNKEYRENNKELLAKKHKQKYENNKEKFAERNKKYHENNKEKVLEKQKGYYENNKEKIAELHKKYRETNKEKIAERAKQKYKCACGSTLRKSDKARHERTEKHQEWVNQPVPNLVFED